MKNRQSPSIDKIPELDFSKILTNPILDIAARLWESDRYAAFQVCYRSMRLADDLVDNVRTAEHPMSETKRSKLADSIQQTVDRFKKGASDDPSQRQLLDAMRAYHIPMWPWERLATAMVYDLNNESFASFLVFLRYCEGAAIAPAAVFVHLCGDRGGNNERAGPKPDIRQIARPLALFSYMTHIMRDFQKDQKVGLNYFPIDLLRKHNLTTSALRKIAEQDDIPASFRRLMADYYRITDYYRQRARHQLDVAGSEFQPSYRSSLELIYELYLQVFERIDPEKGLFTSTELTPTPAEVQARIDLTVARTKQ